MSASRTLALLGACLFGIEVIASYAVKRRLAAFSLEYPMIPPVVIKPQEEEKQTDDHTEKHRACCDIDHGGKLAAEDGHEKAQKVPVTSAEDAARL